MEGNYLYLCTATYIFTDIVKFLTLAIFIVLDFPDKDLSDAHRHGSCLSQSPTSHYSDLHYGALKDSHPPGDSSTRLH